MSYCRYYDEYTGICCMGDCPECADICNHEEHQEWCEFYKDKDGME